MRNPLKVSLVMKRVALTWNHSPLPSSSGGGGGGGGSAEGGGEGARVDMVERVVLQPLSEKMVSLCRLMAIFLAITSVEFIALSNCDYNNWATVVH